MDAKVIKELSRMCRQKAETFSTNIQPFHYHEYAEKLANLMAGKRDAEGNVSIKMKQWTRFGITTLLSRNISQPFIPPVDWLCFLLYT